MDERLGRAKKLWGRVRAHPVIAGIIGLVVFVLPFLRLIGDAGDARTLANWIASIIVFLGSDPVGIVAAVLVVVFAAYIVNDMWLPYARRILFWRRYHSLVIEYDEERDSHASADGGVKMVRLRVQNVRSRSLRNVTLTIRKIEGPDEGQDRARRLIGRALAVSRDPTGDFTAPWGEKPLDRVGVLHPSAEVVFDFVRLTKKPGNLLICHGSYVPGHPHQGRQRWDQSPGGGCSER